MMKLTCGIIVIMFMIMGTLDLQASEYLTYEEIHLEGRNHKLLRDFTERDYDYLYNQNSRRRFWGWQTTDYMRNVPVSFKKETLYIIENEGQTPINQRYFFKSTDQAKTQLSATGSIGIDVSGKVSSFNAGLDSSLSLKASHEFSSTLEETVEINISVDPDTRLFVEIYGEGLLSNGVGERYRFFRNVGSGGFEVFTLQSEHYSIVKERMES